MIQKDQAKKEKNFVVINRVYNASEKITYYYLELGYAEIGHIHNHPYGIGWSYVSYVDHMPQYSLWINKAIEAIQSRWLKEQKPNIEHSPESIKEAIDERNLTSYGNKIIINSLKLDACLNTIYKALEHDEDNLEGFTNHYMYILEDAIKVNWDNHELGEDVSKDEFRRICDSRK